MLFFRILNLMWCWTTGTPSTINQFDKRNDKLLFFPHQRWKVSLLLLLSITVSRPNTSQSVRLKQRPSESKDKSQTWKRREDLKVMNNEMRGRMTKCSLSMKTWFLPLPPWWSGAGPGPQRQQSKTEPEPPKEKKKKQQQQLWTRTRTDWRLIQARQMCKQSWEERRAPSHHLKPKARGALVKPPLNGKEAHCQT